MSFASVDCLQRFQDSFPHCVILKLRFLPAEPCQCWPILREPPRMKAGGCQLGMGFEGSHILMAACKTCLFKMNANHMEPEGCIPCTRRFFYLGKLVLWLLLDSWMPMVPGSCVSLLEGASSSKPLGVGVLLWPEDGNPVSLPYFHYISIYQSVLSLVLNWWQDD